MLFRNGDIEYSPLTADEGKRLIDLLEQDHGLPKDKMAMLIRSNGPELRNYARIKARALGDQYYGKSIFVRGLIEFTNYCKNDCYYCGIRCSNEKAERYRLSKEDIMSCCEEGRRRQRIIIKYCTHRACLWSTERNACIHLRILGIRRAAGLWWE